MSSLCRNLLALPMLALAVPLSALAGPIGPGSLVRVSAYEPASMGPDDEGLISVTAFVPFGSGGSAEAFLTGDGITFRTGAEAPNQNRQQGEPVLARGGEAEVVLRRYFVKLEEGALLQYTFSGFDVQVGYDREASARCPGGREDCLQAGWSSTVSLHRVDAASGLFGEVVNTSIHFVEVGSNPNASSGFYFIEQAPSSFLLDVQVGPNGARVMTPPSQQVCCPNLGLAVLHLQDIAVGEIFGVEFVLKAWAYDGASDSGVGRVARAFVQDPLDPNLGTFLEFTGLEVVEVPEPAIASLLASALVPAWRARRRRDARR